MAIKVTIEIDANREIYNSIKPDDFTSNDVTIESVYAKKKLVYRVISRNPYLVKSIINDFLRVLTPLIKIGGGEARPKCGSMKSGRRHIH